MKMSAFIVSENTLHRIITYLRDSRESAIYVVNEQNFTLATDEGCTAFGQALLNLNTLAVNQRYRENVTPLAYKFRPVPCESVQAFKSLDCLRYQCSEGDVPASLLYKALTEIHYVIANHIVSALPAYDAAKWD
jgi:hypothetical protein